MFDGNYKIRYENKDERRFLIEIAFGECDKKTWERVRASQKL